MHSGTPPTFVYPGAQHRRVKDGGLMSQQMFTVTLGRQLTGDSEGSPNLYLHQSGGHLPPEVNVNRMWPRCHSNKLKMQSDLREDRSGVLEVG